MKKFLVLFSIILPLLLLTSAYSDTIEEVFKKQIAINEGDLVAVFNINGDINVESWDLDKIEITANKKIQAPSSADARKLMKELKIDINYTDNKVTVKTIFPSDNNRHGGFFSWLFCSGGGSAGVRYTIKVPKNIDLNLHSTNGNISVKKCNGKMRLETTNGNIYSDDISGAVRCSSINGSLKIYFKKTDRDEDMEFKTTNGTINLYLPQNINAAITARTMNGTVRCSLPMTDVYEKSDTKLDGTFNNGGPHFMVRTTNGNIDISEN